MRIFLVAILSIALSACSLLGDKGDGDAKGGKGGRGQAPAPRVMVDAARITTVVDRIEAVGTANANEQADLNSTVTERIARINFRDGQFVPRGAVIAELVRSQQGATLNESQARLREAEQQLGRLKQLQAQGFATKARVDEQQAAVDVARAQGAQAGSQIADRVIRAPFSGYVTLRRVSPGAVVNSGTTVVTIVDHSKIKLDFTVPETFISTLKPGLPIEARTAAWPGEAFHGTIATVDPVLDPVSRAATARAILPNPDLRLRPGMLMTVTISSNPRQALTVPELAILGEGANNYVWKVDGSNHVERTVVKAGTRRDGRVEILSGLADGDHVVSEGTVKIRTAGPIQPVWAGGDSQAPAAAAEPAAEAAADTAASAK